MICDTKILFYEIYILRWLQTGKYILTNICPHFELLMLSFKILCAQFMNAVEYMESDFNMFLCSRMETSYIVQNSIRMKIF